MVEGLSCELFFALKVPVNPAFFETGGSHEIGKCSAVVSFLIEDWRCLTNDLLPSLLAFAHVLSLVTQLRDHTVAGRTVLAVG